MKLRTLVRNFLIELALYGFLVVIYFLLVLRLLRDPLTQLFRINLGLYALVGLVLIVVQGIGLEWVTSFLIERLGLEHLE